MIPDCHFSPALEKAMEWGDRIPIGLFYRREGAVYEDSEPALQKGRWSFRNSG